MSMGRTCRPVLTDNKRITILGPVVTPVGIIQGSVRGEDRLYGGSSEKSLMLILTRRVGETVVIGDNVSVTVLGVKGNQIRLGINAPKDVSVHRQEIFDRIQNEAEVPHPDDTE